jgi:hypothetical protein
MPMNASRKLQIIAIVAAFATSSIMVTCLGTLTVISAAYAQKQVTFTFGDKLEGKNEVPPVTTTAIGGVGFNLSSVGSQIVYRIQALDENGSFNVTAADIHQGKAGNNGPRIAALTIIPCTIDFCGAPMYIGQGELTASSLQGPLLGKPLSDLVSLMENGGAYVSVHTQHHPEGEIRGQISR